MTASVRARSVLTLDVTALQRSVIRNVSSFGRKDTDNKFTWADKKNRAISLGFL
jgi:hypothetical protein